MVLKCTAKGCNTKHDGSFEQSFFKFPKQDLKLRQRWLDLLDIPDFVPKPTSSVCWKHFHPSAMRIKWNPNRDNHVRPRRRLVINAVPDYQGPHENQTTDASIWAEEDCGSSVTPKDAEEPLAAEESGTFVPIEDAQVDKIDNLGFNVAAEYISEPHACDKDEEIMRLKKQAHRLQVAIKRRERRIRLIKKDHQIRSDVPDIPPYRRRKLESASPDPINNVPLTDPPFPFEINEYDNEPTNAEGVDGSGQSFPDHAYARSESNLKHVSWSHACSKDDQIVDLRRKVKRLQDCLRNGERRIRMLKLDPTVESR